MINNNLGYCYKCKRSLDRLFKLHKISDFHINNINNKNADENKPKYRNKDEGDFSSTEFEFVKNLKNVYKYINMDESDYNNVIGKYL